MRVLVAPDAFDGTLGAPEAAAAIARGWRRAAPDDDVRTCPLADGGPGLLATLHATLGGELLSATVRAPLGGPAPAAVLVLTDARGVRTAVVESTQATAVAGAAAERPDPARASSAGVGELLRVARATGARRVVVGVGEGATHDAGAGVLAALGVGAGPGGRLDGGGGALAGATVEDLAGLDAARADWSGVDLVVAYAVDLPLLGLHGASAAAAAGRGATPAVAQDLERALAHLARTAVAALGADAVRPDLLAASRPTTPTARLTGQPGSGAGGGLGFGLALLGGRLLPGAAVVADLLGLRTRVADVDLVVTGAAALDPLGLHGGACAVVADHALAAGVPTVAVAGRVDVGRRELAAAGIAAAYAVDEAGTGGGGVPRRGGAATGGPPAAGDAEALSRRVERVARTWSPRAPR